jgi:hypothetical protein
VQFSSACLLLADSPVGVRTMQRPLGMAVHISAWSLPQDEDDSELGLNAYEQQKAARLAEQEALDFPDEVVYAAATLPRDI